MQTLVLVKHSLPEIDPAVPAKDWHLSEEGCVRSRILGEELDRYDLDLVISSIELKAMETAEIVSGLLKVPWKLSKGCTNMCARTSVFWKKNDSSSRSDDFTSNPPIVFSVMKPRPARMTGSRRPYMVFQTAIHRKCGNCHPWDCN